MTTARPRRVKTGCLTCRRKHRKCDEVKKPDTDGNPRCNYCTLNGLGCSWPGFVDNSALMRGTGRHNLKTRKGISDSDENKPEKRARRVDHANGAALLDRNNGTILDHQDLPQDVLANPVLSPLPELFTGPHYSLSQLPALALENHSSPGMQFNGFSDASSSESPPHGLPGPSEGLGHVSRSLRSELKPQAPSHIDPFPEYHTVLRCSTEPANIPDYDCFLTMDRPNDYDLPDTLREFMYLNAISSQGPRSPALTLPSDIPTEEVFEEYFKSTSSEPEPQLAPEQEMVLLKNYVELLGGGLDMFDVDMTFVRTIPTLTKDCEALRYAVLALSARHMETTVTNFPKHLTLQLYEASLRHLVPGYNRTTTSSVIAACVILCVFQMMSSSPKTWRRHLEGCLMLFRSYNIHGFGSPLERGIFWTFIRMDICSAVIGEQHPLVPLQEWLPPGTPLEDATALFISETKGKTLGMHANHMVFLTSWVLHLVLGDKEGLEFQKSWLETWRKLKEWVRTLPKAMKPVFEHEDAKYPFPRVFFSNPHAISSHQMFHMASIIMLQNKPRTTKLLDLNRLSSIPDHPDQSYDDKFFSTSLSWHAKRICGIAITNCDYGAYCNSIQPLYVAGRIMTSKVEHGILLGALRRVETFTGWSTSWRGKDLIEYWNGEC
ncbi:unnamed protein product [Kuraishia capsulata CBS 1993]|uniref:Zn(2)-C6 fungal-type domain-containing protein n=1 Tax=Kuraishia capsulata CBS 1993 TaxID=1382522 RepID=W6MSL2_9ASCO|nr:uncharacterized protein KUCA_T00005789001 [Kuraishia capsulata CBS 1993]CDK29796.1 unnamed protein product [Kuraishia capsulata CBS 1993]